MKKVSIIINDEWMEKVMELFWITKWFNYYIKYLRDWESWWGKMVDMVIKEILNRKNNNDTEEDKKDSTNHDTIEF